MQSYYEVIVSQKWEQMVGRRIPPLRAFLSYEGFYKWFEENFGVKLRNAFITFCYFENGQISVDSFVNCAEKKVIVEALSQKIEKSYDSIIEDFDFFEKSSKELLEVSKRLSERKLIAERFEIFCNAWRKFAPAYLAPIFLETVVENTVLSHYEKKEEMHSKLMTAITSNIQSDVFKITAKKTTEDPFEEKDKKYIELLKRLAKIRDFRKNIYETAWYGLSTQFFKELSEKTKLKEFIQWVSPYEIKERLEKQQTKTPFKMQCLVYALNGRIKIAYEDDFSFLLKKILNLQAQTTELKGSIAFRGEVTGKVRIIMPNDPKELDEGEILVTKMTTADFTPLIGKCSAIVTDEGGVTSHAAIISREFKKPCIVGTKYATKILKTGDLIEVDAEKGTVKKIK